MVLYDIEDDRLRKRVADACLDFGLARIQYSAFLGRLSRGRREELIYRLAALLGSAPANVRIMPLCASDMEGAVELDETGYGLRLLGG